MMNVGEFFKALSVGELSNLGLVSADDPTGITPEKQESLVVYTNEGLNRLFGRFLLREATLLLEQAAGRTTYPLRSDHAMSNFVEDSNHGFYIQDQWGQPFKDDLVKILEVWDSFGRKLPLNDAESVSSLFTPQPDVLQVPHPSNGVVLSVNYQARHPKLVYSSEEFDTAQTIDLTDNLHGALSAYVAYKVFSHTNTVESTAKAAEHMKMFETICLECVQYDLVGTNTATSGVRFEKRGWI